MRVQRVTNDMCCPATSAGFELFELQALNFDVV